ncbi:glycohydrolase toxin TNT-related protein [Amycolatopsis sp. lyj-90]|uniref:glycohydrolase toxin TNT-related protein n=1 Tax=Amycolatopsis sp. lyj-90 TaxID=2789285 RepID=UPI003978FF07
MYEKKTGLRHALARVLIVLLVLALPAGLAGTAVAAEPAPAAAAPAAQNPPPPIDEEDAFNRELVQDIADHAEDVEVRDAARAALATNDPAKIREYLDTGDALARKAAADRKKRVAADNRALVTEWSKTAGPIARQRALDVLGTNDDKKIADFVAFGKDLADAEDRNTVEDAAAKAERIKARVTDMVARGGPEVQVLGQAALDSGDPAVIEEFFTTGYTEANKRDGEARAAIEAAQTARNKALQDLQDLADRSARASNARTQILKSSVQAVKSLTDASNAMGFGNQAAKRADQIFDEDKPGRPAGKRGRAAELAGLTAEAKRQFDGATAAAREATTQAGLSDAAAQQLKDTGLTQGLDWVQVTKAVAAASQAAVKAAETAWRATEATEAASLALDANANAQAHADNAKKYRLSAEEHARQAHDLELAAAAQAAAAQAAAANAHDARLKAEQAERNAWAHAAKARAALDRARSQRAIARQAMTNAVSQAGLANAATRRAIGQQDVALFHAGKAIEAHNNAVGAGNRFIDAGNKAADAAGRAQRARDTLNSAEFNLAAADAAAAAKVGTPEAETTAREAKRARDEVNLARPAAENSRSESNAAGAAAAAAGAEAARASAAAAQARAEAATASREAKKTHDEAVRSRAEADRANAEAVKANTDAQTTVNLAQAAMEQAAQAKTDAELTKSEAEAAASESVVAQVQAKVAGRASLNARVAADGIASPAARALDLAGPLAETDSDAALAADVASLALAIGQDQADKAKSHADQADQAAKDAADAAKRALGEVAPAYQAAADAAQSAAKAVRSAETAIRAARQAAVDATYARDASRRAGYADAQARQDASAAHGVAAEASNDASIARQAYNQALSDASQANLAASAAEGAVKQADDAAAAAEGMANLIGPIAQQMRDLATTLEGMAPQIREAERTKWVTDVQKWLDEHLPGDTKGEFLKGVAGEIVNMGFGIWTLASCGMGPQTGSGPVMGREEACKSIVDGIGKLIDDPKQLLHWDEWAKNPAKALGMTVVDIGSFFIPGAGGLKVGEGVGKGAGKAIVAVGAGAAKTIGSLLMKGMLDIGGTRFAELVGKFGSVNLSKVLGEVSIAQFVKTLDSVGAAYVTKFIADKGGVELGKLLVGKSPADVASALKLVADASDRAALAKLVDELTTRGKLGPDVIPANVPGKMLDGWKPFEKMSREDMAKLWVPDGGWDKTGAWDWPKAAPNNGKVPGTSNPNYQPVKGDVWDRFGDAKFGKNLSPDGVPYAERAIPPTNLGDGYHRYEWIKPWDSNAGAIESSKVAPAFGQPGGGIQFQTSRTVQQLIDDGYLREIF